MAQKLSFADLFDIEMEGWCIGIKKNIDNLDPRSILQVISELYGVFHAAIEKNYVFNIIAVAEHFSVAANRKVNQKTIVFYILSLFPHPKDLTAEQKKTMDQIIDQVEDTFGGAHKRLQKRWNMEEDW